MLLWEEQMVVVRNNVDSKTLKRETAPNAKINPLNKVQEEKLPEASFNG